MKNAKPEYRRHRHPARMAVFALVLLGAAAGAGWLVMTLWNVILVDAIGAKPLGYWQALGLMLLCRILFGQWGPRHTRPISTSGGPREKWASMSPEQRLRFREHWKSRCAQAVQEKPSERPPI